MLNNDQIRMYPIFAGLTDAELAGVAPILKKRAFAAGAYIYYPGNPGLHSYLVESGLVRLFVSTASGQELTLKLVGPQEVFGLPLLDDEQARLIGAVAHQPAVLYAIARQDFLQLMDRSPQFMCNIYKDLATDARRLLLHLRSLATLNLNGRLAAMLLRLEKENDGEDYIVDMPLNQEAFASWLGASRGRLNQAIHQLEDLGMIRVEGSEIVILDYPALERMTEEQTIEEV
jgi:CRP/FNR family cyclic AMP-dependent transcriptional regulator